MSEIRLTSLVKQDEYTNYIQEAFDLSIQDTSEVIIPVNFSLDALNDWQIGVICGASGSGKSTVLKSLGHIEEPNFDDAKCLISNFDNLSPQNACQLLSSMGLASVPTWIRPFSVLSNGEKYRASLAKSLSMSNGNEYILIDEYTSVVDRNVAKAMSNSLQKYIRRTNKKIILATCHYDILEWLQPDWVYDLNKGGVLERGDYLRQRPQIQLQMYRTTSDTWDLFKKYHYMTQDLNKSASCFCFTWDGKLVAFVAVLPLPSGTIKKAYRGSRTVVLPDFQGLGIGSKITEFVASCYKSIGGKYYTKTVNPALGEYRNRSPLWKGTSFNGKYRKEMEDYVDKSGRAYLPRISYCHEYVGDATYDQEELLKPIETLRYEKSMEGQLLLF